MQGLRFTWQYAVRSLTRGGRWTIFGVLCVAAGVAAVVALRGLGLSIQDTLLDSVRQTLKGDVRASIGSSGDNPFAALAFGSDTDGSTSQPIAFNAAQRRVLASVAADTNAELVFWRQAAGIQVAALDAVTVGRPQFLSVLFIDPATYPASHAIVAAQPAGTPLSVLFTGDPFEVAVSANYAEANNVSVGDTVRVTGSTALFRVVGVIPTEDEAGLTDLIAGFFGFAYLPNNAAAVLDTTADPNRAALALPNSDAAPRVRSALREDLRTTGGFVDLDDVVSRRENLATVTEVIGRLIVILGLGALLIGGVGIINTMLVLVRRRTMEIAALKTFGLKGGQVARLFLADAILLGVVGSVLGGVLGTALQWVANQYGETLLQQPLVWRLYPEAILYGLVLGLVTTAVFGVLPVLAASSVRPAIVLRPNEAHVARAGVVQSLFALLVVVLAAGAMVAGILQDLTPWHLGWDLLWSTLGVAGTFLLLGLLVALLWVVVWLVSKLPTFGNVDLRLALRNLTVGRWRTATTLLALAAGMYALSSIAFVSAGVNEVLAFQFTNTLGGNVLVVPLASFAVGDVATRPVINRARQIAGVEATTTLTVSTGNLRAVNGEVFVGSAFPFAEEDFDPSAFRDPSTDGPPQFSSSSITMIARDTTNPNLNSGRLSAGRDLTAADNGQRVAVVTAGSVPMALRPGDVLTVEVRNRNVDLTVVGVAGESNNPLANNGIFVPPGALPGRGDVSLITVLAAPDQLNQVLLGLSEIPLVVVLDLQFLTGLIDRLVAQFAAIPNIVGLLSLLAAATIMANTVLLAALERRKQIGVLKAVGMKGRRLLGVLLLENALMALLGAGLGIGLSALSAYIITLTGQVGAIPLPSAVLPLTLALVGAAVGIAALATLGSANVILRERVANVLRYD